MRSRWDCKLVLPASYNTQALFEGASNTYKDIFKYTTTSDQKKLDLYEVTDLEVSDDNYLNVKFEIVSAKLSKDSPLPLLENLIPGSSFIPQGVEIQNIFQLVVSVISSYSYYYLEVSIKITSPNNVYDTSSPPCSYTKMIKIIVFPDNSITYTYSSSITQDAITKNFYLNYSEINVTHTTSITINVNKFFNNRNLYLLK